MIAKINDVVMKVQWSHDVSGRQTVCSLTPLEGDGSKIFTITGTLGDHPQGVTGVAECSKRDQFCKDKGRKISLARAMKRLGLFREQRTAIWDVVLAETRGGHKKRGS
jgi:hypothetical protein